MAFGFLNYLAKYHVPSFANLDFGILHKYGAPSRDEDYLARFSGDTSYQILHIPLNLPVRPHAYQW
jgi:hypothetical protein